MKVAEVFDSSQCEDLSIAPAALYVLAEPSTPEAAKKEAITRAQSGEPITYTVAKSIKQKYCSPKRDLTIEPQPEINSYLKSCNPHGPKDTTPAPLALLSPSQTTSTSTAEANSTFVSAPQLKSFPSGWQVESISGPSTLPIEQREAELSPRKLEIIAIRPKESAALANLVEIEKAVEKANVAQNPPCEFVQPGTWWQLEKEHLLYCGDPQSTRFRARLPEKVALSLAFPPTSDWRLNCLSSEHLSSFALFTRYQQDQDLQLFREMIERLLMLYTEGCDSVVFSFLPDPSILVLAHELECRWFCAEPDPAHCEAAIAALRASGFKAEKVTGLRF